MTDHVDVLVLTALKEELDALLQVTEAVQEPWSTTDGDPPLHKAILEGRTGPIRVAAVRQTKMAGVATAILAARLIEVLKPRCIAMCGVCAGHPEDTELGDVIIAERLFQHDEGKIRHDGFQGDLWVDALRDDWLRVAQDLSGPGRALGLYADPAGDDWKWWFLERLAAGRDPLRSSALRRYIPDERRQDSLKTLRAVGLVKLRNKVFTLTKAGKTAVEEHQVMRGTLVTKHPFDIHVGPVGTGNAVEAGGTIWDRSAASGMRKVLAVEMEAAAIGRVAHGRNLPFAVVKGVMDHADEYKSDRFKGFAARASAEVLCLFLREVMVSEREPKRREKVAFSRDPLLAAQEAAWTRRSALRGAFPAPLSQLYVDPALAVPGLQGRKTLFSWLSGDLPGPKRLVITGEVGSGKTELLHVTAARLAAHARGENTAPIPLLVDAIDLQNAADLREAAVQSYPQAREAVTALLAGGSTPIVLMVDRLDEAADPDLDARVVRLCEEYDERLVALIATTRPSYRPALGECTAIELPRWTESDTQRFLDLLASSSPAGKILQRLSSDRVMVRELLSNPLTATILALLSEDEVRTLEHPVHLYRALIEYLFQRWARRRLNGPKWAMYEPDLRRWAREMVEGERSGIERGVLRRLIREEHADDSADVGDAIELGLGVLIPRGDRYEFLFRSLAEHLAGKDIAAGGVPAICAVAREPWAQEALRHAAGCLRSAIERTELLDGLLIDEESDLPGVSDERLRVVLGAIDIAADAHHVDPAVTERLTRATFRRLTEEYSNWVGDQVARRVPRLLQNDGPLAEALTSQCVNLLRLHNAALALPDDRQSLRALLHHRDAAVCRAVIRKLHSEFEHTEVQLDLFQLIFDGRDSGFGGSVGFEAALALRAVPRTHLSPKVLEDLIGLLDDEIGGKPFAHSVLALLPGEASVEKLAHHLELCIRRGLDTCEPVDALLAHPGGAQVFGRGLPEWRKKLDANTSAHRRLARPLLQALAPSLVARMRASEALSARLHRLDEALLTEILDDKDNLHALMHCMNKLDASLHPKIIERAARSRWLLCPGCRRALSGAAELRGAVRDQLIHWWDVESKALAADEGARSYFPGEMLEPLVLEDGDAARVYSEWLAELVHTRYINVPRDVWSHAPFRSPQVMGTVREFVFDEHDRPREGALRLLVKGWQGDPVTWERLTAHVDRSFHRAAHGCLHHALAWPLPDDRPGAISRGGLLTALSTLDVVPPAEFLTTFLSGCRLQLNRALLGVQYGGSITEIVPPSLFPVLRRLELVDGLWSELCALAGLDRPPVTTIGLHAAVLVARNLEQKERRRLSRVWAEHFQRTAQAELLPAEELSNLMSQEPSAWRSALVAYARSIERTVAYPHVALGMLPGIPAELARDVLPAWLNAGKRWRLPWIERQFAERYLARIDDELRERAFATRRW